MPDGETRANRHPALKQRQIFGAFAAVRLPAGVWLEHYGPRRVESVPLALAAAGASRIAFALGLQTLAYAWFAWGWRRHAAHLHAAPSAAPRRRT